MAHLYILRCRDGSFYVGSTIDLDRRIAQHAHGEGAAYTRRRLPVVLVYHQQFDRIEQAYSAEKQVQNWSRAKRIALIEGRFELLPSLAKKRFGRPLVE
ncbi:GIY-YIG nuclease family protein [Agromyces humatus]|uniref:GIY-YIG nuclease family protein n=1 Tax=Agromyces humatus TaxID=279573 RepID=A0ABP4WFD9_9MICO|nr:GIY-YIG nuclease family protein [Agromyces humatus]